MKKSLRFLNLLLVLLFTATQLSFGEGSKQLTPGQSASPLTDPANDRAGYLSHDANLAANTGVAPSSLSFLKPAGFSRNGVSYSTDHRLYIRVRSGETLYYGVRRAIHEQGTGNQANLNITLRRVIASGPSSGAEDATFNNNTGFLTRTLTNNTTSTRGMLLNAQPGVIGTAAQAAVGPNRAGVTNGYAPLSVTNSTTTDYDYYVEFTQVGEANMSDEQRFSVYDLWDFTVTDASGAEKPGRMRSKLWSFSAGGTTNVFSRTFNMFPLIPSQDEAGKFFVKKIELAGIAPQNYFRFVTNSTGTTSGTTNLEKRKSQTTQSDFPEFFSYVNNPDPDIWPSATVPTFSVAINSTCNPTNGAGKSTFTVNTSQRSTFIALINLNGQAGYQPNTADVLIENTGLSGSRTVEWNGLNGLNQPVPNNTSLTYTFRNGSALIHFPVWDAEVNNGFRVEDVRPVASATAYNSLLFWDDSNLSTAIFPAPQTQLLGIAPATGNTSGVHTWGTTTATNNAGDLKTINTWTYGHINTEDRTATYTYDCSADVGVTQTITPAPYTIGKPLTFTVTVTNNGPLPATNVTVTDKLDPSKFGEITSPDAAYNSSTGVWTVGSLAVGASRTLTITAKPLVTGPVTSTATQGHNEIDNNSANNSAPVDITVIPSADIEVKNTVPQTPYNTGDLVTYTITAKNLGPNAATGVVVNDKLPANLVLQGTAPAGYNATTGDWSVGTLAINETKTLTLAVRPNAIGTYTTTATLGSRSNNELDENNNNNTSSNTITVNASADVAVTNVVSNATPNQNGTITYTIKATNNGPNGATNVVVSGPIPAGVSFTNYSATVGSATTSNGNMVWNVGTILPSTMQTLIITATPTATGQFTFTTTQTHTEADNNTGNNSDFKIITVQPTADVQVTNVITSPTPTNNTYKNGDVVDYLITVKNNGPSTATSVRVDYKLPASFTNITYTPSANTTYNATAATEQWSVGTLTNGASATLIARGTINQSAVITTTATQAHFEFDNINGNNSASNSIQSGTGTITADINIKTTSDAATYYTGNPVTFTVRATNEGQDAATDVKIYAPLPAGITPISFTPKVGTYDTNTQIWTIPALANNGFTELILTGTPTRDDNVTGDKAYTFEASRTGTLAQVDNDPTDDKSATNIVVKKRADVSTNVTVTGANANGTYYRGVSEVTYEITFTNNGPDIVTNLKGRYAQNNTVTISERVPEPGTTYSSGIWSIGTLLPGQTKKFTVKGIPNTTGRLALTSSVVTDATTNYPYDNISENNTYRALIDVVPVVDLQVTNTVSSPTFNNGETITFTVKVQNNETDVATNVVIQDILPAGLDLVSATASSGSYDRSNGLWTLGSDVLPGSENAQTLTLTVKPQAAATYSTTASLKIPTSQYDKTTANNSQTAQTTGNASADIALTSSIVPGPYYIGSQYPVTITATNNGPDAATGVVIGSVVSPGLRLVPGSGVPASGTTIDPATGRWIIGNLPANQPKNLTFLVEPISSGIFNNVGYKLAENEFDPNGGTTSNGNNSTVVVLNVSDRATAYQVLLTGKHYYYFRTGQHIAIASDPDGTIQSASFVSGTRNYAGSTTNLLSLPTGIRLESNGELEVTSQYALLPGTYKLLIETTDAGGGVSSNEVTYVISGDWDGDGVADDVDLDDNNDGVITEPGATNPTGDADNDGIYNYLDVDFIHPIYGAFRDQNGDDIHDAFDLDLDGLIRGYDVDIDGDGITNVIEAYGGIIPTNINYDPLTGTIGGPVNQFGIPTAILKSGTNNQSDLPALDSDNDGRRDYEDIDSDNDGILDVIEAQATNSYINRSGTDADRDGLDDRYDPTCGCGSNGTTIIPVNTDTQDKPDYLDLNSDNDSSLDYIEAYDDNQNGTVIDDLKQRAFNFESNNNKIGYYTITDDNRNSIPNWLELNNTSQYPQFLTYATPPTSYYHDRNRDGLVDLFDPSAGGRRSFLQTTIQPNGTNEYVFRSANNVVLLPVTLVSFTATKQSHGNLLNWSTASEQNNAYFIVEKSQDGKIFEAIGEVKGNGNSTHLIQYSFLDKQAWGTVTYYRLKQVDFNSKFAYSHVIAVQGSKQNQAVPTAKLYPNPAEETTNLDLMDLPEQEFTITIINITGRIVKQASGKGNNLMKLDVSDLATGKYLIQIKGTDYIQNLNLLKN